LASLFILASVLAPSAFAEDSGTTSNFAAPIIPAEANKGDAQVLNALEKAISDDKPLQPAEMGTPPETPREITVSPPGFSPPSKGSASAAAKSEAEGFVEMDEEPELQPGNTRNQTAPPLEAEGNDKKEREIVTEDLEGGPSAPAPTAKGAGGNGLDDFSLNNPPPDEDTAPTIKNEVTNLEFRMKSDVARIIVTFRNRPYFREQKNQSLKQIVYYFNNAVTPQRLQRAYDTTEFATAVSLFTLLQMPGENPPLSKLIVQLREDQSPKVITTGNTLYIEFPPYTQKQNTKVVLTEQDNTETEENIYASGRTFSGKRIQRLEIKNSDIQDVLRLIAKTSGYNIVVGEDVTGRVGTLSLENIPWDQAFTLVLQSKKLGYVRQGNVLRVGTLTSLKSEKEEALANEQSRIKVEPLRTVLIPVSYAKANEMIARIRPFMSPRGTTDQDTRTNTIILRDVDKTITRVQKLINALDTQPARVSISAKIIEMLSSFSRGLGFSQHNFNESFQGVNIEQVIAMGGTGASFTTLRAPNFANLATRFQIGESEDKVKILASPSIIVLANQQGNIQQKVTFFDIIAQPQNSAGAGTTFATPPTLAQITSQLNMGVTPIVSGEGSITLDLSLQNDIPRGAAGSRSIDNRQVRTQILLDNGDTAVIGGVFNSTVTTAKSGFPFLMRIPILGFFFSGGNTLDSRNEIFIFVTAKILNPDESFKRTF